MRSNALTAVDLFCGCGGLTEGLKQAGFNVLAAVDNDPAAVAAYRLNHSETKVLLADIKDISPTELSTSMFPSSGTVDLVAGCPPCQGFSTLSSRNGKLDQSGDTRNDLIFEFMRFVRTLGPRAVMLENVPGLYRDERFQKITEELRLLGYKFDARILDASDFGVPQRRKRLVLIGRKDRVPLFAPIDDEKRTVRDAIGSLPLPGDSGDPSHDISENRSERIQSLIRSIPHDGGSRSSLPEEQVLACHKNCSGFKDVYGRMAWNSLSPTITTGCFNPSRGRFVHPEQDRAITLREAAILQSFPASYAFPALGKQVLGRLIGNALPPEMIRRHAVAAFGDL